MNCTIEGCDSKPGMIRKGLCVKHYMRLRKTGRLDLESDEERFWSRVDKTDGCWIWTGTLWRQGYGQFFYRGKNRKAHRVAYEFCKGPIPGDLPLDHLCRNRACVNPDHLEPVTLAENILRGEAPPAKNARRDHCIHGHELFGENLEIWPEGKGFRRRCRTCRLETQRRYDARKKATTQ